MSTTKQNKKARTLEQRLDQLLPDWPSFDLQFHELWRDSEGGWTVNDSWTPFRNCPREEAIARLRSRWEVFKVNYLPDARVSDLTDIGCGDDDCLLEVDCTAFATITRGE